VILWLDLSAGVAGDMLLGALIDAGAPLEAVRAAVDAVIPATVRLTATPTTRAGLRATSLRVGLLAPDQPNRPWAGLRDLLTAAPLADAVRGRAMAAFTALARAEARVHGIDEADVHFHEVGAWDAIADVVGVCAALEALGVRQVVAGELALGSGTVRTAHGVLPVPVPAVLDLCRGRSVTSGGDGELTTPTGAALVTTLATGWGPLPAMTVSAVGVGAGTRDRPDRANVVRAVVGHPAAGPAGDAASSPGGLEPMVLVETTVDDLDPRVWPSVLDELLAAGAADAWLTPVLMKKGRPGQVLSALASPPLAPAVRRLVLDRTSTLGVRQTVVERETLDRVWVDVELPEGRVAVKVGGRDGLVVHATPEFEDVARLASSGASTTSGRPVRELLDAAAAAAVNAGLAPGAPFPEGQSPEGQAEGAAIWAARCPAP
jgi:pyridinium-3,5-bisthiocarboxylic acid mononucleotide nickel chelatase